MLDYIPIIYEDELLYSVIGRYHKMSGNLSYKKTLKDIFGMDTIIPIIELPCHLTELRNRVPEVLNFEPDKIMIENTLFPLYKPFLDEKISKDIMENMKCGKGDRVKLKSGIVAGGICKKDSLYYCPECSKEEIGKYGEAYIHRTHQAEGVWVCESHECLLKSYNQRIGSRLEYVHFERSLLDFSTEYLDSSEKSSFIALISREVGYLLNEGVKEALKLNQKEVNLRLREGLSIKGYMTIGGSVKQKKLIEDFREYYGLEFLEKMESNIDRKNGDNWLSSLVRKPRESIHPIRNILAIVFLFGGLENFFKFQKREQNPFGSSPWVCMNPFCDGYKKKVVNECRVTSDYKTRETVGTFTCSCGFSYSRKKNDDMYKVGTIKNYGIIWEEELKRNLEIGGSIREIARKMHCDSKTIKKYAFKIGCEDYIPLSAKKEAPIEEEVEAESFKRDIMKFMESNTNASREEVMRSLYKAYIWLYNNERDWLEDVIPGYSKKSPNKTDKKTKTWERKEAELLVLLKEEYTRASEEGLTRITKSLLGRRVKKSAIIDKKLDKMPNVMKYLEEVCETVEQFQIRRVRSVCNRMLENGESLVEWKVIKESGLKPNMSKQVREEVWKLINKEKNA